MNNTASHNANNGGGGGTPKPSRANTGRFRRRPASEPSGQHREYLRRFGNAAQVGEPDDVTRGGQVAAPPPDQGFVEVTARSLSSEAAINPPVPSAPARQPHADTAAARPPVTSAAMTPVPPQVDHRLHEELSDIDVLLSQWRLDRAKEAGRGESSTVEQEMAVTDVRLPSGPSHYDHSLCRLHCLQAVARSKR